MVRPQKQADFVGLNLRLPPELHKELVKAAGPSSSLNSEIIRRLQGSFAETLDKVRREFKAEVDKRLREERRLAEENMRRLAKSVEELKARLPEVEERKLTEKILWRLQDLEARLPESKREEAAT